MSKTTNDWITHRFTQQDNVQHMAEQEWLLTNGTGAFASGTVIGCNTRRYHSLLCATKHPPVERQILIPQLFEQLQLHKPNDADQDIELTTCAFRNSTNTATTYAPQGALMLESFERGLTVTWTYAYETLRFQRALNLHWKQQAATLTYRIWNLDPDQYKSATLYLSPMTLLRDFHELLKHDTPDQPTFQHDNNILRISRANTTATLQSSLGRFQPAPDWWYNIFYPIEQYRGQDDREDYFIPGRFNIPLTKDIFSPTQENALTLHITLALGDQPAEPEPFPTQRIKHLSPILTKLQNDHDKTDLLNRSPKTIHQLHQQFSIASDDFIVQRTVHNRALSTIIAGYPWFADWGRDTFIALPGLMLTTGRLTEAKSTLQTFAAAIQNGLIPNRFDDYDDSAAHYNTVDASLWFIHAAHAYLHASNDQDAWQSWLSEACIKIIEAYQHGTDYNIHMTVDGLISAGDPNTQLTWMDAKCNDIAFTPRYGKAVEISALWFHCLTLLSVSLRKANKPEHATAYSKLAKLVKKNFITTFWNSDTNALYDVIYIDEHGNLQKDPAIRPNMLFACSLEHSPLPLTKRKAIIETARQKLLTPLGMRTLAEDDPRFEPHYIGDQFNRDKAYHQGTIWPWPIGTFAEAVLRTGKFSKKCRREAFAIIEPLLDRLTQNGVGQLHEIFQAESIPDASAPDSHKPVGCPAQAWSISETLRLLNLIEKP
ncbi:amylo-alpha-1,6-glucosidase [Poriferisphaera sp. WC338]|uniref:amylo-alpha-1,6-glucosidase n=1 Tax=Poriferisphaera sp. WC338 TaxID=3425129 RepID=UPI003D817F9B